MLGEEGVAEQKEAKDRIVQQTDQDASISRTSAVTIGYLDDPFAQEFVSTEAQRRFPIINRGTMRSYGEGVPLIVLIKAHMFGPRQSTDWSISF